MKRIVKRILAWVLATVLFFQLLPVSVRAEGTSALTQEGEAVEEHFFSDYTADDVLCEIDEQRTATEMGTLVFPWS